MPVKFKRITDIEVAREYHKAGLLLADCPPYEVAKRGRFYYHRERVDYTYPREIESHETWMLEPEHFNADYIVFIALED